MKIIQSSKINKVQASATTTIWEYPMDEQAMSGAVAEINGRYPEKGFAVNSVSKELAFVISGKGYIVSGKKKQALEVGDLVFLDVDEQFAWEGKLTIFMATSPKFFPGQHRISYE